MEAVERIERRLLAAMAPGENPPVSAMPEYAPRTSREIADLCVELLERYPKPTHVKRKGADGKIHSYPVRTERVGRIEISSRDRLSLGNRKLRGIAIWSLPAITTCVSCAECRAKCYALKSQTLYPDVFRFRYENLYLWAEQRKWLEGALIRQLHRSPYDTVRWHESGDFFSQEYIDWTAALAASKIPGTERWYCYSKAEESFDLSPLEKVGVNIVRSYLPDGGVNFTEKTLAKGGGVEARDRAKRLLAQGHDVKVCPATLSKGVNCGERKWGGHCTRCFTRPYTVFVLH